MATFQAVNTSFEIPDAGEVFTSSGDPNKTAVYARVGDEIKTLGLQDLGAQLLPQGNGKQQLGAAKNYLAEQGLDIDSLPQRNFADVHAAFGRKGNISAVTDFGEFQGFLQQAGTAPTANPGGDIVNFGADRTLAFTTPEGKSLVAGGGTTTEVPNTTFDNPLVLDAEGNRLNKDQPLSNAPNTNPFKTTQGGQPVNQPTTTPYSPKGITSASDFMELAGITTASDNMQDFLNNRKTASSILAEEFERRGIEEQQSLLSDLDKRIRAQEDILSDLPEAIQSSLADVGVTQSQLTRLTAREAKKPTELLNDLLRERNALSKEINTAIGFAQQFANTQMEEQAVKLSALEFALTREDKQFAQMTKESQAQMKTALDEQKNIMEIAKDALDAGADQNLIERILDADSPVSAMILAAENGPKSTFERRTVGKNVVEFELNPQGEVIGQRVVSQGANTGDTNEKKDTFADADTIIKQGNDLSYYELRSKLQEETKLDESEITTKLKAAGRSDKEEELAGEISNALLEGEKGLFRTSKQEAQIALGKIATLKSITVDGKVIPITESMRRRIEQLIRESL